MVYRNSCHCAAHLWLVGRVSRQGRAVHVWPWRFCELARRHPPVGAVEHELHLRLEVEPSRKRAAGGGGTVLEGGVGRMAQLLLFRTSLRLRRGDSANIAVAIAFLGFLSVLGSCALRSPDRRARAGSTRLPPRCACLRCVEARARSGAGLCFAPAGPCAVAAARLALNTTRRGVVQSTPAAPVNVLRDQVLLFLVPRSRCLVPSSRAVLQQRVAVRLSGAADQQRLF